MNTKLNWLGVVVAAVVGWLIGALWYGMLFAQKWQALTGVNPDEGAAAATTSMALGFLQTLVMMIGLGWLIARLNGGWIGGLKTGLLAAVFFALMTAAYGYIYTGSPLTLLLIDWGHLLLVYGVGGAVIGGLKLGRRV